MQIVLHGFESSNIEVTPTPTEIIVHAAPKEEKKTQKGTAQWTEFGSNDVYRCFNVTNPIAVEKVTANLENGILRTGAPLTAKPKEIKTAAA